MNTDEERLGQMKRVLYDAARRHQAGACRFGGSLAPPSAGHACDWQVSFSGTGCALGGRSFSGHAYREPTTGVLRAAALDAAGTQGVLFVGTRP